MAITLRTIKGTALTHAELDGNFTDLDTRLDTVETTLLSNPNIGNENIDFGNNLISYSNTVADEASLANYNPNTYTGMTIHVASTGALYYAHSGAWRKLLTDVTYGSPTTQGYVNPLSDVAYTGSFNDLIDVPPVFSFDGSYTSLTNKPTIPQDISELADINSLLFSGSYNDLTNKPAIPTDISAFSDDSGRIPTDISDLTDNTNAIPTALSQLSNDLDYAAIVGSAIQNNGLPVLPTQTLDISGSVFADDSSVMVDAVSNRLYAESFDGIAVRASIIDSPTGSGLLQIKSGADDGTGNVIYINPYGSNTFVQTKAETHIWATGPYSGTGNPYITFTTDGKFEAVDGAYFVGNLTGNVTGAVDGDLTGSVFADDSTTIIDGISKKVNAIDADFVNVQISTDFYSPIVRTLEVRPNGASNLDLHTANVVSGDGGIVKIYGGGSVSGNDGYVEISGSGLAVKVTNVPASSIGAAGDKQGMIAVDATSMYYCIADYDGAANIWVKTDWATTGAW